LSGGVWTVIFGIVAAGLFIFQPEWRLRGLRLALGIAFFLELFYIIGHYLSGWPFPTPLAVVQLFIVAALGVGLGAIFSRVWPIPPQKGFERIIRTLLISIPSLGLGIGLQMLLQGEQPTQALYLVFTLAAWLGSGFTVRQEEKK